MISVVIPFYNEKESVGELHERLLCVLQGLGKPFEIIFVDDGSTDGTFAEIQKLKPVRGFRFKKNRGQTAAFGQGIRAANGDIVVTSDGDLENQPEDIPRLIAKLDEGYDIAAGWRKSRWSDQPFTRRIPSNIASRLISAATGVWLHDHGCNLRAYQKKVFDGVEFTGEMHRMLAAYLGLRGASVGEVPVSYVARKYGVSKYGISRIFRVILDVIALYFYREYAGRPMHFFGYFGFISFTCALFSFLLMVYLRLVQGIHFIRTPLPVLIAVLTVIGVQFVLMGLLAELVRKGRGPAGEAESVESIEHA